MSGFIGHTISVLLNQQQIIQKGGGNVPLKHYNYKSGCLIRFVLQSEDC